MRMLLITVFCLSAAACSDGTAPLWSQAKPETIITVDPVSKTMKVHNSKDVDLSVDKVFIKASGVEFELENLKIVDNASAVRTANVAQLEAVGPVTEALMEPWVTLAGRMNVTTSPPPAEPVAAGQGETDP